MLRDLLHRFRPAGTPGAAGSAGVPAEPHASAELELAPVFAALADVERECAAIRAAADARAADCLRRARQRADALLAAAQADVAPRRAAAAAAARARAETALQALRAEADRTVAEDEATAEARIPGLVRRIQDRAWQLAAEAGGGS